MDCTSLQLYDYEMVQMDNNNWLGVRVCCQKSKKFKLGCWPTHLTPISYCFLLKKMILKFKSLLKKWIVFLYNYKIMKWIIIIDWV